MPTKPIQSFVFATGVNYAVGPQAGNPTKIVPGDTINGLVPGDGVPAAWMNYMWNICGQWSGWLLAGSPLAGLDAHLVETDATGKAELAMLELGGTAAGAIALVVNQNTGAPSAAATCTNTGAGFGLNASAAGALAAVRGTNTGTGPGVEGLALGTNNDGMRGVGQGIGSGGRFVGGATGPGSTCTGGASGGMGSLCTGTVDGQGLVAYGGPTAPEALLAAATKTDAAGVHGQSAMAATAAGAGVWGEGRGDAPGVRSSAAAGYGVVAETDTTSPTRAPLRKVPQNADPLMAASGDETHRSDLDIPRVFADGIWQSPWTTASGHAHGLAAPRTVNATNADAAAYVTLVSVNVAAPYEPRFAGGKLLLLASARFGDENSTNHHYFVDVQIYDLTAGAQVWADTITTGAANEDATVNGKAISQWSASIPYTIPATGARTLLLRFKPNAANGFAVVGNQASLNVLGVFG